MKTLALLVVLLIASVAQAGWQLGTSDDGHLGVWTDAGSGRPWTLVSATDVKRVYTSGSATLTVRIESGKTYWPPARWPLMLPHAYSIV